MGRPLGGPWEALERPLKRFLLGGPAPVLGGVRLEATGKERQVSLPKTASVWKVLRGLGGLWEAPLGGFAERPWSCFERFLGGS